MRKILFIALAAVMVMPYGYGVLLTEHYAEVEEKTANELIVAATNGDLKEVKKIIKDNPDIIQTQYNRIGDAITAAIDKGHAKVVKYLVETKYADIHAIKVTATTDTGSARRTVNNAKKEIETLKAQAEGKPDVVKVLEKEQTRLEKLLNEINEKEETFG
ncbi:MAG: hypothetical protein WCW33_01415 [Candidatus Babeliales bacterium]|jgi:hypothetical protein